MTPMPHQELTHEVIGGCFEVIGELGVGFLESVYERALVIALEARSLRPEQQTPIDVCFRGFVVGQYFAGLIVESKVNVEPNTVKKLAPEHAAQTINYLKATGMDVALLVNFADPKLGWRRYDRKKYIL